MKRVVEDAGSIIGHVPCIRCRWELGKRGSSPAIATSQACSSVFRRTGMEAVVFGCGGSDGGAEVPHVHRNSDNYPSLLPNEGKG